MFMIKAYYGLLCLSYAYIKFMSQTNSVEILSTCVLKIIKVYCKFHCLYTEILFD